MPAAISISELKYAGPDGRVLFNDLDLTLGAERTGLIGRNGIGKSTLISLIAGEIRPRSGQIVVRGKLGVLRQQMESGVNVAEAFGVADALRVLERAETGEATAQELASADWGLEARLLEALARMGVDASPDVPLAALSGGQQTRIALAALTFNAPDFLLLDEPTNNLDRAGREAVAELLAGWRGGALVVSHDRGLLDGMDAIVELSSLGAARYGGGWRQYQERKSLELAAARHDLARAEKRLADAARDAQARVERQARRDGAGKRKAAKGDMPRIAIGMRKDNSEATGAGNTRLAARQHAEAAEAAGAARARVEVLQPMTVSAPSTGLPAGRIVLRLDKVAAGYEAGRPVFRDFSMVVAGPERIAVTGANGSGKSTLLALITGRLTPLAGDAQTLVDFAMLDQSVRLLDGASSIRDNYLRLNPKADENACRAALARFLFRADASLQIASTLSGGERLRAGLACVLGSAPPSLLILDEPTNHLDIHSIEAVESGLRAYDGALIVVSHDEAFLHNIKVKRRVSLT